MKDKVPTLVSCIILALVIAVIGTHRLSTTHEYDEEEIESAAIENVAPVSNTDTTSHANN